MNEYHQYHQVVSRTFWVFLKFHGKVAVIDLNFVKDNKFY